jgi:hypothetical protein
MIFGYKDFRAQNKDLEFIKMTLNGKNIHPKYEVSVIEGVRTFIFTPEYPGLYEWTVNYYITYPDGTIRPYSFNGKVNVRD